MRTRMPRVKLMKIGRQQKHEDDEEKEWEAKYFFINY